MGAVISFENISDSWLYRMGHFEVLLYYAVFRNSDRERLPTMFPDVEREISEYLNEVEPENYPDPGGSLGLIVYTDYPLAERRELFEAMKRGVEEIRVTEQGKELRWRFEAKGNFVRLGEELIGLMEQSLAASEAEMAAAVPDTGPAQES